VTTTIDREVDLFGIGAGLREARLRRGLALADVERETCIRAANLEAIEDEQFDELPGDVYAAAFVREYAAFLDLDADYFVERFRDERAHEPLPLAFDAVRTRAQPRRGPLVLVAAVVLAAAIAGAVFLFRGGGETKPAAVRTAPAKPAAAQPTHAPLGPLVLRAPRGDSWVVVRFGNAHGRLVWQGTLKQGRMLRFGLDRPLWVGLGQPQAVTARLGQKRVRLDPNRSRYVFGRR
jgi:hypothetical protein